MPGGLGPGDGVVVEIGEIHIRFDRHALCLQIAGDQIGDDETAAEQEIGRFIGGRTAGIEGDMPFLLRGEDLFFLVRVLKNLSCDFFSSTFFGGVKSGVLR